MPRKKNELLKENEEESIDETIETQDFEAYATKQLKKMMYEDEDETIEEDDTISQITEPVVEEPVKKSKQKRNYSEQTLEDMRQRMKKAQEARKTKAAEAREKREAERAQKKLELKKKAELRADKTFKKLLGEYTRKEMSKLVKEQDNNVKFLREQKKAKYRKGQEVESSESESESEEESEEESITDESSFYTESTISEVKPKKRSSKKATVKKTVEEPVQPTRRQYQQIIF